MAPRRRPAKAKGKQGEGEDGVNSPTKHPPHEGHKKGRLEKDDKDANGDDWTDVAKHLDALAAQNKKIASLSLSSSSHDSNGTLPGSRLAANVTAVASFLLYANTIVVCKFPYDDNKAIRQNPDVLNLRGGVGGGGTAMSSFADIWKNDFWGTPLNSPYTHKSYRPLVIWSFRLDASITSEPWMFHLTNALMYAACSWLVVDVLLRPTLFRLHSSVSSSSSSLAEGTTARNILALSGLWFASHPVHVESVAGLVGRAEILSAIFCLLGAMYGERRRLVLSVACFAAACLCKETAVLVPAMLGVVELLTIFLVIPGVSPTTADVGGAAAGGGMGGAGGGGRKKKGSTTEKKKKGEEEKEKERWERVSAYVFVSFAYLLFRSWLFSNSSGQGSTLKGSVMLEDSFMQHVKPTDKLRTALYIMATYVRIMVWPGALSCDYGLGVIDPVTSWMSFEIAFVVVTAGAVLAWALYGLYRLRTFGDASPLLAGGWAFAPLVPASHLLDIGTVMAERLAFTPTVGVSMLLCHVCGVLAVSKPKAWKGTVQMALLAVAVWFGMRTLNRVPDWEESKTLFLADVKSHPRGVKLLNAAAKQLILDDPGLGFEYAKRAQEITDGYEGVFQRERYVTGLTQMANLKVRTEKWPEGANATEAIEYVDEVIRIGEQVQAMDEDTTRIVYTIKGTAYFRLGRVTRDQELFAKAIENFEIAVGFDNGRRGDRTLYCEYATCLAQSGKKEEAYDTFQICFSREAEEDLVLADFQNYAVLMKELSGVDHKNDRDRALASAEKWGDRAVEGILRYMKHKDFRPSHSKAWAKIIGEVKFLQTGMNEALKEGRQ